LAVSSFSAVISSCTRLSGSRSIVNFTRARPLSDRRIGGEVSPEHPERE
jgi:hypothetical protein